jgi:hypothetical protein
MSSDLPRHRGPERARGATRSTLLVVGVVAAVLVAIGIGTAAYAHRGAHDEATDPQVPAVTPTAGPSTPGSDPTPYVAQDTTPPKRPATISRSHDRMKVLPGVVIKHLSAEQIQAQKQAQEQAQSDSQGFDFEMATLNMLGSNHTVKGGDKGGWPAASWRTAEAAAYLKATGAQIIGTQEDKPDQLTDLTSRLGYDAYPGNSLGGTFSGNNSILWDPSRFQMVSATYFWITFMSGQHQQPVVLFKDIATGREFYMVNMHVSAHDDPHDTATRYAGYATAVAYINAKLKPTGLPVFITGDMNDREPFVSRVLDPTGFHAAVYGSACKTCFTGGRLAVDWIAATPEVTWTGFDANGVMQDRHISDHFLVSAHASVPAASD